ncbi:MAG: SGNH/GDSL hydrolase family protein [Acidobacteriota bacterium]|nr:SGNH/GDSL hydrolase family protein [Acidobacteriota bacterium]
MFPLLLAGALFGQTQPQTPPQTDIQLADRLSQLMESTAVAIPGLVQASDPLRRLALATLESLRAAPQDAALKYRFARQAAAYVALSDTFSRPEPFPPTAAQQSNELRDDLADFQRRLESALSSSASAALSRDADPVNAARYAEANAKLPPPGPGPRIVFFGDSITDLWRLNEYFVGRDFVNRGISGQTTLQMLGRFLQDVVALKPKAVLILAGTNDIARGIKAGEIEDNLAMMAELANANGIKPLFASILPVSDYHKDAEGHNEMTRGRPPATIRQINGWIQDYCRREGFTYVDYFSAMVDATGQIPADLADDGLHPNSKGYRVMAPIALDNLNRALAPQSAPEKKRRLGILK